MPAGRDDPEFSQRLDFSLDFWWLYLYYLGAISAPVAVALGAAPLVGRLAGVEEGVVSARRDGTPGEAGDRKWQRRREQTAPRASATGADTARR